MDERHLAVRDPDDVARAQGVVTVDRLPPHDRAISAVQVTNRPFAAGQKHLGVVAAAPLVLDDNFVSGSATNGDGAPRREPKDVRPLRAFADDEIS